MLTQCPVFEFVTPAGAMWLLAHFILSLCKLFACEYHRYKD